VKIADLAGPEPLNQEPVAQKSPVGSGHTVSTPVDIPPETATDSVQVSSIASRAIQSITTPASRLSELQQQIRDGSYQISPDKISQKIIDSMKDG
jgi:anti-sigma28 factor (negative regulator of flagellin synthesis)